MHAKYTYSVNRGPPVSIAWDFHNELIMDLEKYEQARSNTRRNQSQMKMPADVRSQILLECGYSEKEIRKVAKDATIARKQRIKTIDLLHQEGIEEKFEEVKRAFMKPFQRRKVRDVEKRLEQYLKNQKQKDQVWFSEKSMKATTHPFSCLNCLHVSKTAQIHHVLQAQSSDEDKTLPKVHFIDDSDDGGVKMLDIVDSPPHNTPEAILSKLFQSCIH